MVYGYICRQLIWQGPRYRVAQNKIPHRRICNISATSGLISDTSLNLTLYNVSTAPQRYTPLKINPRISLAGLKVYTFATSCTFVKLQLKEQGTNLYRDAGEFDGRWGIWRTLSYRLGNLESMVTMVTSLNRSRHSLGHNVLLKHRERYAKALNQTQL